MAKTTSKRPRTGEQTKRTSTSLPTVGIADMYRNAIVHSAGTYDTYRQMRSDPTIALARVVAQGPIRTRTVSTTSDDDASEAAEALMQDHVDRLWQQFMRFALLSLDYGWSPFEVVWEVVDGALQVVKVKPLKVDDTEQVEYDGDIGLRQGDVKLLPTNSAVFVHDWEPGRPYGRPRHENIRANAWDPYCGIVKRVSTYVEKVAGAVPVVWHPEGEAQDKSGATKSNYEIAQAILRQLSQAKGVTAPMIFSPWAKDLIRDGANVKDLLAWRIDFIEAKGQHGGDLVSLMQHFESLMARGWLVPERAILEGTHGTKAEAGEHASMGVQISELLADDIMRTFQREILDPVLHYNFGEQAVGTVRIESAGLPPEQIAFFRDLFAKTIGDPKNIDLFQLAVDLDRVMDIAEIPKAQETVQPDQPVLPKRDDDETPSGVKASLGRIWHRIRGK